MNAAGIRIFILLLICCVTAFGYEISKISSMETVTGVVVAKAYKGYILRYTVQGESYRLKIRIGIIDSLNDFRSLSPGAKVPLLVNPRTPYVALPDTLNSKYGVTLSFVALLLIVAVVFLVVIRRRAGSP